MHKGRSILKTRPDLTFISPGTLPILMSSRRSCGGIDSQSERSPPSGAIDVRLSTIRSPVFASTATSAYTDRGRASVVITPDTMPKSTSIAQSATNGRSAAFFTSALGNDIFSTCGGGSGMTSGSSTHCPGDFSTRAKTARASANFSGSPLSDSTRSITPYDVLHQAADTSRCIHIAVVAEGYKADEMEHYLDDCQKAIGSLFNHEPFRSMQDRFNIIAVKSVSEESGTSEPSKGIWKNTALGSHFDTFYSDRYLTTLHLKRLHDLLAGTPYEHIIILVNTEHYGGGGIYNSYNLCYTGGKHFLPVVVHEFGHSFGGLGDEYAYGNDDPIYFSDTEPWEPNLTTQATAYVKWEHLIQEGKAGLIEGGGYLEKGVWRGCENCRMRTNEEPEFCVVCQEALVRLIDFYTK